MLDHSLLVESVDRRRLGGSAGGNDVLGDHFDGRQFVRGEKEIGASDAKAHAKRAAPSTRSQNLSTR